MNNDFVVVKHMNSGRRENIVSSSELQQETPFEEAIRSLADIFVTYTLNLTTNDFDNISFVGGEAAAMRETNNLVKKFPKNDATLDSEIFRQKELCANGYITPKQRDAKIHKAYARYGCDAWDATFRSWCSPVAKRAIGMVDVQTFLEHLSHRRLLDYALNLTEKVMVPGQDEC